MFDRQTRVTNPLGHYQTFVFDKRGKVTEHKWYQHGTGDTLLAHRKTLYDEVGRGYEEQDLLQGTTDQWLAPPASG